MERTEIFDWDFVNFVMNFAQIHGVHTGYALFNTLPMGAKNALIGKIYNPFPDKLERADVADWVEKHLIFDGNGLVIRVFDKDEIVWEK